MKKSTRLLATYTSKLPSQFTNKDVVQLLDDYREWLDASPENVTFSAFCKSKGIPNPYQLKNYLMTHFTGLDNTVDFQSLWQEIEKIREDKLIELGLFNKDVNANFLTQLMKSRFGWHDNTIVVGISMEDIVQAKRLAVAEKSKEQ